MVGLAGNTKLKPRRHEVCGDVPAVAARPSASDPAEAGTLLKVSFRRNPHLKHKYLEAEPKILGVHLKLMFKGNAIVSNASRAEGFCFVLLCFFAVCRLPFYLVLAESSNSVMLAFSSVGIISGSLAIAAQKLHLPTLKACLGMQVVTCMAYIFCLLGTLTELYLYTVCFWHHIKMKHGNTCIQLEISWMARTGLAPQGRIIDYCMLLMLCLISVYLWIVCPLFLQKGYAVLCFLDELTDVTQIVLSLTIAAYCCKAIPCCSSGSNVVSNVHFIDHAQFSNVNGFYFLAHHRYGANHGYAMKGRVCAP
ncbi:uncharacterized protein LOC122347915 [Puntigrus tetrazona]|uniref:uncharacterized protein LOC122347915 n=1 Tax=Puntigrus tetrazona TaxID=1606681 RepID=UPI001C8A8563|nr:uncharacterized protein LOC122347915 [Puntigrus tetrazona]